MDDKRKNLTKKEKFLTSAITVLAVIDIIAAAAYLLGDIFIPGLLPFTTALMMAGFVIVLNQKNKEENKIISIICLVAAILNVFSGIFQIIDAI